MIAHIVIDGSAQQILHHVLAAPHPRVGRSFVPTGHHHPRRWEVGARIAAVAFVIVAQISAH